MALTPERIAELERLKEMMRQPALDAQRKAQAIFNAEKNAGTPVRLPTDRAKGGSVKDKALKLFMKGTKAKERLYHGTGNLEGLTSFDPAMTGKGVDQLGSGFYLSNDPEEASGYAGKFHAHTGEENKSPGVVAAHVAIRNPIKIGKKGMSLKDARINLSHDQVKQIMEHVPDLRHPERSPLYNHVDTSRGVTPHMINDIAKLYTGNTLHALENDMFYDNPTAYRTALNKVLGYDGVVKDFGNGRKHYVAWFPNQIKSAIGNRGTYDPNETDITKAKGGTISQDAMQLALMNKKHMAYGGPARNWAPGQEEKLKKALSPLKKKVRTEGINNHTAEDAAHDMAINQWLDSVAHNYIKKQMATEKDPVRQQAESDVFHLNVPEEPGYWQRKGETRRKISGGEQMAKSDKAKTWENRTDAMLEAEEAQAHQDMMHLAPGMYSDKDEWVKKLDPKAKLWNLTEHFDPADLGLDHIRDVLHEDLVSGRIRPEQLSKISMAQAVQRAHQYDQEMEKKRQETAIKQTEGMPTVHDYPEEGMKWIELAPEPAENLRAKHEASVRKDFPDLEGVDPNKFKEYVKDSMYSSRTIDQQKLAEALKYEGDTMGHCVGSYCPDVIEGRSRIFSLRDKKGEPHVTIETEPYKTGQWLDSIPEDEYQKLAQQYKQETKSESMIGFPSWASQFAPIEQRIVQIKGKGNAKPHKKYIPHVQHFVKSGKWAHVGDINNTDLRQSKDWIAPDTQEAYKKHGIQLPEYATDEELDNIHNQYTKVAEPQNYKAPQPIKKAEGGNVQLSVEQMRQQLMNAGKQLPDISQIGAQEAPNMPVKSFVSTSGGQDGQMPVGGVDMSPSQPGHQLLPANMMQPQPQAPQQPQGAPTPLSGLTAPQGGGSNILQMTPQGQKMAALSPMQPPAPVQKAMGGGISSLGGMMSEAIGGPVAPFQQQYDNNATQMPNLVKDGDSLHAPVDNQNGDNGATNFSIDNTNGFAKGGSAKKPLHYDPAPSLSKAEINAMAERMVRQMSGLDNPNNKTLQQLAREQNLPIGIKGSKKMDVPIINYEELKGAYSVGVPGDTSRGGVKPTKGGSMGAPKAGEYLTHIGGEKLDQPVGLFGGKDYGAFGHPAGWASDLGASAGMFNVVKKLAEENPEREVYGHYHKMSPEALNHAVHMLDAVLSHHKPHASPAERIAMLNDLMRNQKTTTSKHDVPYPEFPGFENPADIMLQGQMNSGMRKKIIGLLGKEKYFPGGKQKLDDIIYAISHPELRNIETGAGGSAIIKFDPTRNLKESMSPHPTYGHDIPSKLAGRTRYLTPAELLAPRSMHNAKREIAAIGKKVVPFNQAKMNIIREPIDEQYINQMGEYEQAMKKRLGYKKGGNVKGAKVTDNLDTMRLALTRNKKAK